MSNGHFTTLSGNVLLKGGVSLSHAVPLEGVWQNSVTVMERSNRRDSKQPTLLSSLPEASLAF